jgi:sugar phosphate isomerase/epimerase
LLRITKHAIIEPSRRWEGLTVTFGACLSLDKYDLLVECGYDGICLPAAVLAEMEDAEFDCTADKIKGGPLICEDLNLFCRADVKLAGPEWPAGLREYAGRLFARAERLGIKRICVGSGGSRRLPEGYDRSRGMEELAESFSILSAMGAEHGIQMLIEPLNSRECNFINTTEEALALIDMLPRGKLGLTYDSYHADYMKEDLGWIGKAADKIGVVHLSHEINSNRCYLQPEHIAHYCAYADALKATGYKGGVFLEAGYGELSAELPRTLAILKEAF